MKKAFATFVALLGLPFILWGLFLFALQLLYWFKAGVWAPVSLLDVFVAPPDIEFRAMRLIPHDPAPEALWGSFPWLSYPSNWFGAHKIIHGLLETIPLSLALVVFGFVVSFQTFRFGQPANPTPSEPT